MYQGRGAGGIERTLARPVVLPAFAPTDKQGVGKANDPETAVGGNDNALQSTTRRKAAKNCEKVGRNKRPP